MTLRDVRCVAVLEPWKHRRDARGIHAEVRRDERREAPDQQPGAEEQDQREGDLGDDEALPDPAMLVAGARALARLLHPVGQVLARGVPRRHDAHDQCRDHRERQARDERFGHQSQLHLVGHALPRQDGRRPRGYPPTPAGSRRAAPPSASRPDSVSSWAMRRSRAAAERRAKRHLPLTRGGPREQHVGDVAARDEQEQDHGAEQREQHVAEPADDAVPQVEHFHAEPLRVLVGIQLGAPLRDRRHPFRRLRERDPGREVGLVPEAAFVGRRRPPPQREWHPHVGRLPRESRRHHADDGSRRVADCHDLTQDVVAAAELLDPRAVVEHDDRGRARPGIVLGEHAPLERLHAEDRETCSASSR